MNVLIPELNPGPANIRHNYFVTLMIIKILKYFCEEHNQKFQRIFFMKEDDGISIRYALPRNPQVTEDNNKFEAMGQKETETTRQADLYYNMTISNYKDIGAKLQKLQRNIDTMNSYMTQLETYSYGNIKPANN
jgi:hypothetical protein